MVWRVVWSCPTSSSSCLILASWSAIVCETWAWTGSLCLSARRCDQGCSKARQTRSFQTLGAFSKKDCINSGNSRGSIFFAAAIQRSISLPRKLGLPNGIRPDLAGSRSRCSWSGTAPARGRKSRVQPPRTCATCHRGAPAPPARCCLLRAGIVAFHDATVFRARPCRVCHALLVRSWMNDRDTLREHTDRRSYDHRCA